MKSGKAEKLKIELESGHIITLESKSPMDSIFNKRRLDRLRERGLVTRVEKTSSEEFSSLVTVHV